MTFVNSFLDSFHTSVNVTVFKHHIGLFGFRNFNIIRTVSITDVTQSTCQVDFQTINNQPTTSIQLMTTPTNMITSDTTNMIAMNDVFSSSTDSTPLTIIVSSVVGGVLGLFIIFICILGLFIRSRRRQHNIKNGVSNSMYNRYVHACTV